MNLGSFSSDATAAYSSVVDTSKIIGWVGRNSRLVIKPNVVEMGSIYAFNLQASIFKNFKSNGQKMVTFILKVTVEPVVANLAGGDNVTVIVGGDASSHTFDASASSDPADDNNFPLRYKYTLYDQFRNKIQSWPVKGYCKPSSTDNCKTLTVATKLWQPDQDLIMEAKVKGKPINGSERTSVATQNVRTTALVMPLLQVRLPRKRERYNIEERIPFQAVLLNMPLTDIVSLTWTCTKGNFNASYPGNFAFPLGSLRYVIAENVLRSSRDYEMTITAVDTKGVAGNATAKFSVNAPPTRGRCYAEPNNGTALETTFRLHCKDWSDEDMPLRYQFFIKEQKSESRPAISKPQEQSYFDTVLPASNDSLTILARIRDTLGAVW